MLPCECQKRPVGSQLVLIGAFTDNVSMPHDLVFHCGRDQSPVLVILSLMFITLVAESKYDVSYIQSAIHFL